MKSFVPRLKVHAPKHKSLGSPMKKQLYWLFFHINF